MVSIFQLECALIFLISGFLRPCQAITQATPKTFPSRQLTAARPGDISGRMKREQHKATVKNKVLQAAKESFQEKGYSRTPITEIMKKAGVSNGTLYHFFKNKEDILLHITREMLDLTVIVSDNVSKDTPNPWVHFCIEIAMQFSLVLYHPNIAEMYLIAHESGPISSEITQRIHERTLFLFKDIQADIGEDHLFALTLAVKGLIHSFIQRAIHADCKPEPSLAFKSLDLVLNMFQIPRDVKVETLTKAHELIMHHPNVFHGLLTGHDRETPVQPVV